MGRLFGTDGVRGVAVTELTCERAVKIGQAAALVLGRKLDCHPRIYIGKDTRISSDLLEAALVAGICSVGGEAFLLGVVPTPAVAFLVTRYEADAGIMISASHNSVEFNGIKIFAGNGCKLSDEMEEEIEALVLDHPEEIILQQGVAVGRVHREVKGADWDYMRHLIHSIDGDLSGLRVAIDCANGSAAMTAEKIFSHLGAHCLMVSASPNGGNINDNCGSTHMDQLMTFVPQNKCHLGVAFDGDADRCLAVDETGALVDGDKLIAIFARDMKKRGILSQNAAVVTVMSNLGFAKFCEAEGVQMVQTKVGDRYVLEAMQENGYVLGGEQSGHIIFLDAATTGDGQLTAVRLLDVLKRSGRKMSQVAGLMERYPQVIVNIKTNAAFKKKWREDDMITCRIQAFEREMAGNGRILVRESGTEPLIRIMAEGKDFAQINWYVSELADMMARKSRDMENME